jgi:hypothetical protein
LKKFELILQGEYSPITKTIIEEYLKLPFVERIILSTYEAGICYDVPNEVELVLNDVVEPRGTGNRNLQINTSRNGLALTQGEYCVKMRTDQLIRSMDMMYEYWKKRHEDGKLFVLGMYRAFPYHPRDHVFWGKTEDVKNLFDIPFDPDSEKNPQQDYRYKTRAETYIGQFYYARFDESIQEHIDNPTQFTTDFAPRKNEALTKDFTIRHKVFAPFPKISLAWPKHGLTEYHYHVGKIFTEYWGEDD